MANNMSSHPQNWEKVLKGKLEDSSVKKFCPSSFSLCSTWSLPPRQKTQLKPCPCVQIASELLIQTPLLGDSSPSSLLPAFLCFPWGDFWSQFFNFLFCFVFLALGMWTLSSLTRDRTCTPVLEAQGLNHWTTRDVPKPILKIIQRTL